MPLSLRRSRVTGAGDMENGISRIAHVSDVLFARECSRAARGPPARFCITQALGLLRDSRSYLRGTATGAVFTLSPLHSPAFAVVCDPALIRAIFTGRSGEAPRRRRQLRPVVVRLPYLVVHFLSWS